MAGRDGNLLLNVSPTGDGALPPAQVERLDAIATWMEGNAESIIDTEAGLEQPRSAPGSHAIEPAEALEPACPHAARLGY